MGSDRVAERMRRRPVRSPGCPLPHARPSTGTGARFARSAARLCLGILPDAPEPSWGPGREGDVVVLEHGSPAVAAEYVLCADPVAMP